ncbi:MAG: hypothetical protein ACOYKQ_03040, partial [Polymorphobacter sp.]
NCATATRITACPLPDVRPEKINLGASPKAANVGALRSDMSPGSLCIVASAFVAADTPFGPVWFVYGQSGDTGSVCRVPGQVL